MNKVSANRQKRKAPKSAWKPGNSGNPKGAPKRGESWTEIIKRVGDLTPSEAAATSLELAKQLLKIGDGLTLKEAVVLRVYGALLFEPNPGLLNAFMNRAEGMPTQAVELSGPDKKEITIRAFDYGIAIAAIAPRPESDSESSGAGESDSDGAQVG